MKKNLTMSFLVVAVMGTILTVLSCSKGDNEPETVAVVNPQKVFMSGLPKSVAGMTIQTNEKGQIISMKSADKNIIFKYTEAVTRSIAPSPDVIMTVTGRDINKVVCNLYLNKDVDVRKCDKIDYYYEDRPETNHMYNFSYDRDGHLVKATIKGGEEVWSWIYENGDITRVERTDHGEKDDEPWKLYYTSASHLSPIVNKGYLMLFNENIPADLNELSFAYFAGMLGTSTKHLPLRVVESGHESTFSWTLNESRYPTSLKFINHRGRTENYSFVW